MSRYTTRVCSSVSSDVSDEDGVGGGGTNTVEDDAYQGDNEDDVYASDASSVDETVKTCDGASSAKMEEIELKVLGGGTEQLHAGASGRDCSSASAPEVGPSSKTAESGHPGGDHFKIEMTLKEREDIGLQDIDENENSPEGNVVMKKIYRSASLESPDNAPEGKVVHRKTCRSMSVQYSKPVLKRHRNSTSLSKPEDFDFDFFDDDDMDPIGGNDAIPGENFDEYVTNPVEKDDCDSGVEGKCESDPDQHVEEAGDAQGRRNLFSTQTSGYITSRSHEDPTDDVFVKEDGHTKQLNTVESTSLTNQEIKQSDSEVAQQIPVNVLALPNASLNSMDKKSLGCGGGSLENSNSHSVGCPEVEVISLSNQDSKQSDIDKGHGEGVGQIPLHVLNLPDTSLSSVDEKSLSCGGVSLQNANPHCGGLPAILDDFSSTDMSESWREDKESITPGNVHENANVRELVKQKCDPNVNAPRIENPGARNKHKRQAQTASVPETRLQKLNFTMGGDICTPENRANLGSQLDSTGQEPCSCPGNQTFASQKSQPVDPAKNTKSTESGQTSSSSLAKVNCPSESPVMTNVDNLKLVRKEPVEPSTNKSVVIQPEALGKEMVTKPVTEVSRPMKPSAWVGGNLCRATVMKNARLSEDRGFIRKSKHSSSDGACETFDINESVDLVDISELIIGKGVEELEKQISLAARCWRGSHCDNAECEEGRYILDEFEHSLTDQNTSKMSVQARDKIFECLQFHSEDCLETYCCVPFCFFQRMYSDTEADTTLQTVLGYYMGPSSFTSQGEVHRERFQLLCSDHLVKLQEGVDWYPVIFLDKFSTGNTVIAYPTTNGTRKIDESVGSFSDNPWIVSKVWYRGEPHDELLRTLGKNVHYPYISSHLWCLQLNKVLYVCRELSSGVSLGDCLQSGPFSSDMVLFFLHQLLSAAEFLHQRGVVFLLWIGSAIELNLSRDKLKLSDFSAARCLYEEDLEDIDVHLPPKVTPIEFLCDPVPPLKVQNDSWGLGHLCYEMVSGKSYFHELRHETPTDFRTKLQGLASLDVPASFGSYAPVLKGCWQLDPSRRQTASELLRTICQK